MVRGRSACECTSARMAVTRLLDGDTLRVHCRVLVLFIAVLAVCYAPAWVTPYGLSHDYTLLARALHGDLAAETALKVAQGRPVLAPMLGAAFGLMRGIGDLRCLRAFGVLAIALLAWSLFRALRRSGWSHPPSLFLPVLVCTLPPFQVYAGWTVCAFFPLAAIASGYALRL